MVQTLVFCLFAISDFVVSYLSILFFFSARIPLYLCAFLETDDKAKQFEYLRLTSLGVIGALVKVTS